MRRRLDTLRELYEGHTGRAHRFRYALLFDVATIAFVIATSFAEHGILVEVLDVLFGLVILADFLARFAIERRKLSCLASPVTVADLLAIASFLAPIAGEGVGFLRVLRTLRLLHTYQLLSRLRRDFPFFRRNEEVVIAAINLVVFLRPDAVGPGDDHRRHPVPAPGAGAVPAAQGALSLPRVRPDPPRSRCGALQALRHDAEDQDRGRGLIPRPWLTAHRYRTEGDRAGWR